MMFGIPSTSNEEEYQRGWNAGYLAGDAERQALATECDSLRNDLREALVQLDPRLRWTFDDIKFQTAVDL